MGQVFLQARVDGKSLTGTARPPTSSRRAPARWCMPSTRRATRSRSRPVVAQRRLSVGRRDRAGAARPAPRSSAAPCWTRASIVMFGYPGGAIMPFYHALPEYPGAQARAGAARAGRGARRRRLRTRQRPAGVCVATSGPGATNLVTGIATAHMDSTPLVAITGQVPRAMIGRDAFQETDIIGITQPITKHSRLVEDVEELADAVREAFAVAREGRPGPVLLDVPKDVQNQKLAYTDPAPRVRGGPRARGSSAARRRWPSSRPRRLIGRAERPLIMAGHGVILERRVRRAASPGRADRHPGDHHAARHQRVSRVASPASGHAGHARRSAREPGDPAGRSHHRRRASASTTG